MYAKWRIYKPSQSQEDQASQIQLLCLMSSQAASDLAHSAVDLIQRRIDLVLEVCKEQGRINRTLLCESFGITPLQASHLLREFLRVYALVVAWDERVGAYLLTEHHTNPHALIPRSVLDGSHRTSA